MNLMNLLKRNPVFWGLCISLMLISVGLAVAAFFESGKLAKAKAQVISADGRLKDLMYASPAPTNKNVKAAEANMEELRERLQSIREELQRGAQLDVSDDGVRVISNILRFISDYRKRVETHVDSNSVPAPILVPDQFAFGFEQYFNSTIIPEGSIVPELDKQRLVLIHILDKLIEANPSGIQSVERESIQASRKKDRGFTIAPAISAHVPGVIDTLAFRIKFTGYTPTLRKFLNKLAYFELPIVVRSVEVSRTQSSKKTGNREEETADKTPVISEIESIFTVTLEFIEIVESPNPEDDFS